MTARSEITVTINQPIEKVAQAYSTREYWEFIAEKLSPEPGELHEFADNTATLFEILPKSILPEAAQAMVSQDLKLKRVVEFGPLADGTTTGKVNAEVKGAPVSFSADVTLTGTGEATELKADCAVDVKIPMMGAVLEPKVAEWVEEFLTREAALIQKWISDNA